MLRKLRRIRRELLKKKSKKNKRPKRRKRESLIGATTRQWSKLSKKWKSRLRETASSKREKTKNTLSKVTLVT